VHSRRILLEKYKHFKLLKKHEKYIITPLRPHVFEKKTNFKYFVVIWSLFGTTLKKKCLKMSKIAEISEKK